MVAHLGKAIIWGSCALLTWTVPAQARFLQADPIGYEDGPTGRNVFTNRLVSHTGSNSPTERADASAWRALARADTAGEAGVTGTPITASDAAVISAGNEMNAALGNVDRPGNTTYAELPGYFTPDGAGNSNGAAYGVAQTAVQSENPGASQMLPPGGGTQGAEQWRRVTLRCQASADQCPD